MINTFANYSTIVNFKRRQLYCLYSQEEQRNIQIVYLLYINNPNLHEEEDCMLKIGTCTLDRFEDRYKEHVQKFSTNMSILDISIIPNASQEKAFHSFMEKNHNKYEKIFSDEDELEKLKNATGTDYSKCLNIIKQLLSLSNIHKGVFREWNATIPEQIGKYVG
jgi:hypothetical protein